ncbi:ATP-dependent DNA/RNA helicase DHX36-like [Epargyreus clarus]|uniref:ATP-dependent DNA/RNA helicase DHX36-like n=1 Tax=Epargyreus clarus TaxID=520877 RepID=UPI003C2ADB54
MSSDFNNWNTPYKKPRLNSRPPGLRGKEIGLYYRNRSLLKKMEEKPKKVFSLTFTMPPAVAATVRKNIQNIIMTAQEEKITLPPLKINYLDNDDMKAEALLEKDYNNDNITKIFDTIKQQYDIRNDPVVKSEPPDDTNNTSTVRAEPSEETNFDPSTVKTEPAGDADSDINTSTVNSKSLDQINETNVAKVKSEPEGDNRDKNDCPVAESAAPNKIIPGTTKEMVCKPSTSQSDDCISPNLSDIESSMSTEADLNSEFTEVPYEGLKRELGVRYSSAFKYGYQDIITGTFNEKLEERLALGIDITVENSQSEALSETFYVEYNKMIESNQYKKMLEFRKTLPTYKKAADILEALSNNQVLVISGETGCGKSTQVPQIILDDAISSKRGGNVKILVTQPRRIAASALAMRVAKERSEKLGNSVGYAVRLERVQERSRGSIQFCTTGILLSDLEVNQSLGNFSHIILDEVHERDSHIDLAMCMLKQVLRKRKDLKLILMSATIDSDSLSIYFDNCLKMHIEGLAYPVTDVYLEDILTMTKFVLHDDRAQRNQNLLRNKWYNKKKRLETLEARDQQVTQKYMDEVGDWLRSKRDVLDVNVYKMLTNPKVEEMNYDLVLALLRHICSGDPGAILVFLPGYNDISHLLKLLHDHHFRSNRYQIHPLHSKLPTLEQHLIFEKPPKHIRKIIIATNIAETSITVDDIVYVIDCGRHKVTGLNVEQNIETLDVRYITKANLRQRRGRAGRCQPGICYHLITSFRAEQLEERVLPELQRSNLLEPVLMVKRLRLGLAAEALKYTPSPPAESSITWAVKHLQRCGALNAEEVLTPLGWHMARLPLHPSAGKLLLLGALFGCLDRAASVAAVWGFKDPFLLIVGKEQEIEQCKFELTLGEPSDHIAVSEAIISWEQCPRSARRDFCYANYLSHKTLELLSDMKKQLGGNLKAMGFLPSGDVKASWENRNADNLSLFKAIVAAALYPNIASVRWIGLNSRRAHPNIRIVARTPEEGKVLLHPSSALSGSQSARQRISRGLSGIRSGANWLVYWMKRRSTHLYIFDVTLVYSLPLLFFGDFILTKDPDTEDIWLLEVSEIKVRVTTETAELLYDLRALLDHVLASKVMSDGHSMRVSRFEEQVLNTVTELITAEDEQAEYVEGDMMESDRDSDRSDYD